MEVSRWWDTRSLKTQKRGRTGKLVCRCGKGYGSEFDGMCFNCRGINGWEAKGEWISVRNQLIEALEKEGLVILAGKTGVSLVRRKS